jgi:hypothetical protein
MRVLSPDMTGREKISDANRSRAHTTSMDLYSHVTDMMQADAAARLDTAFQTAKTRLQSQS